jgi:hypothetical protein
MKGCLDTSWTLFVATGSSPWWQDPLVDIGIAQTLVFLLQLFVFGYQAKKLRETVESAEKQSLAHWLNARS